MKLVTWNCNGALRRKLDIADSLDADVLVIQECENPALSTLDYQKWAGNYLWKGESKNRGIGIFPRNGYSVEELDWQGEFSVSGFQSKSDTLTWNTNDLKLFLPFTINNDITALAVWTKLNNSETFGYIGQFWKYLQIHRSDLSNPKTIILGDFNSNVTWDRCDRWWNHSNVIDELSVMGVKSLYHEISEEEQGRETRATFFMHRKREKPYHIDYVFTSSDLVEKCSLDIGGFDDWSSVSDHMPLVLNMDRK